MKKKSFNLLFDENHAQNDIFSMLPFSKSKNCTQS